MVRPQFRPDGVDPITIRDIPALPGYVTLTQAAKILGMTKNGVRHKVYEQRMIKRVFKIGDDDEEGERSILLFDANEIDAIKSGVGTVRPPTPAQLLRDWNHRVKAWGEKVHIDGVRIAMTGRPRKELVDAYLAAHPDDPKPQ